MSFNSNFHTWKTNLLAVGGVNCS